MSKSVIGALRVNLGLDSAQFERGVKRLDDPIKRMRTKFLAVSAAAATVGAALVSLTVATSETAAEISRFSQVANASTGEFQQWAAGAKSVGIGQEKLADILKDVNDRVGDFLTTGGGPMADFFEKIAPKIGITADAFKGLSGPQSLQLYVDSLQKAGASQQEMTFYLEAMASDTTALIPLLRDGGVEMARLGENAASLGGVMSASTVSSLKGLRVALGDASTAVQGIGYRISGELAPALTSLVVGFNDSMRAGGLLRTVIDGLISNLDVITYSAGVAVTAFGVRYVGALALSTISTFSLVGALAALKTALITSGIGALVVGAGYLIAKFADLVKGAGGFGEAMVLIGDVAREVWSAMRLHALAFAESFRGLVADVKGIWASGIAYLGQKWADFVSKIGTPLNEISELIGSDLKIDTMATQAWASALGHAAENAKSVAAGHEATATALRDLAGLPLKSVGRLREAMNAAGEAAETTDTVVSTLGGTGTTAGDKVSKGAKKASDTIKGPLVSAIDSAASALGDWAARGFKDFSTFTSSMLSAFQQMVSKMIATAIANPIKIALGVGGTSVAGKAASGGGGLLSGLGGKLLGGFGEGASLFGSGGLAAGFSSLAGGTGFLGGLGQTLSSTLGTGGGLGGLFSVGANAAAAGGGILASIGAALPVIGIVAGVFSFFQKKTKLLDAGIRATIDMENAMFESFEKIQTSQFWGLSKRTSFKYSDISDDEAAPFTAAVFGIQESVIGAIDSLGLSTDVLTGFSHEFSVSLKDLDDAAKEAAVLEALQGLGDAMAEEIFGLDEFMAAGEGAYDALTRLSTALGTVNDAFRDLGFSAFNVSLAGADAADEFANLFGSLDDFTSASAAYYDAFYSDNEKLANATARLTESLTGLGINFVPETHAAFRDLVDTAMLGGDSDLAAQLIMLAPAFDSVTEAANTLSGALNSAVDEDAFATGVDYRRGMARANSGIDYAPLVSQAEMLVELRAMNARLDMLQSTSEITAANTGKTADSSEEQVLLAVEATL
jgi:hypothetical protein